MDDGTNTTTIDKKTFPIPVLEKEDLDSELKELDTKLKELGTSITSGNADLKKETDALSTLEKKRGVLLEGMVLKNEELKLLDESKSENKQKVATLKQEIIKIEKESNELLESINKLNPEKTQESLIVLEKTKDSVLKRSSEVDFTLKNAEVLRPFPKKLKTSRDLKDLSKYSQSSNKGERIELYNDVKDDPNAANLLSNMFRDDQLSAEKEHIEKKIDEKAKNVVDEAKKEMERRAEEAKKVVKDIMNGKSVGKEIISLPILNDVVNSVEIPLQIERSKGLVSKILEGLKKKSDFLKMTPHNRNILLVGLLMTIGVGVVVRANKDTELPNAPQKKEALVKEPEKLILPVLIEKKEAIKDEPKITPLPVEKMVPVTAPEIKTERFLTYDPKQNWMLAMVLAEKIPKKSPEELNSLVKFREEIKNLKNDDNIKNYIKKYLEEKGYHGFDDSGYALLSSKISTDHTDDVVMYKKNTVMEIIDEKKIPLTKARALSVLQMFRGDVERSIKIGDSEAISSIELQPLLEKLYLLSIVDKLNPEKLSDEKLQETSYVEFIKTIAEEERTK